MKWYWFFGYRKKPLKILKRTTRGWAEIMDCHWTLGAELKAAEYLQVYEGTALKIVDDERQRWSVMFGRNGK